MYNLNRYLTLADSIIADSVKPDANQQRLPAYSSDASTSRSGSSSGLTLGTTSAASQVEVKLCSKWKRMTLSTTYRVTENMTRFVNEVDKYGLFYFVWISMCYDSH